MKSLLAEIKFNSSVVDPNDLWQPANDRLIFSTMKYELIVAINENFTFHESDLQIRAVGLMEDGFASRPDCLDSGSSGGREIKR